MANTSFHGKPITQYRLIPEEVLDDEGFDADDFEEGDTFQLGKQSSDLMEITIWRAKKDKTIVPVGYTDFPDGGMYRACTLADVEHLYFEGEL